MDILKKKVKRIISTVLAFVLIINPTLVRIALAEEGESEEPTEIVEQTVTETPDETPSSTIETGDAQTEVEVETTANENETTIEIPCTPCEGETECSEEVVNDNQAEVATETTSQANTGSNTTTGSFGDATIDTGDATASAEIEDKVNVNTVNLEGEDCSECEDSEEEVLLGEGVGGVEVTVENTNQADVSNDANVLADTGENSASENAGDAGITTGDALAYANLVNLVNTNVVGSDFVINVENYTDGLSSDIDLNAIWQEILGDQDLGLTLTGDGDVDLLVVNANQATVENDVNVTAVSGRNAANDNGGDAEIDTGNASALANVFNFVNVNVLGSEFFLGVFNIFGLFDGDLVLPKADFFMSTVEESEEPEVMSQSEDQSSSVFVNNNEVELGGDVITQSDTGNNETSENLGSNSIETGNAQSQSNLFSLVNTNVSNSNWFFLVVNSLGSKVGNIFGWAMPGSVQEDDNQLSVYELGMETGQNNVIAESGGSEVFENDNEAIITNDVTVTSITGQNTANENGGDATITTGDAMSLANVVDFANLNILGSKWFLGVVNILGDWNGNTYFAYPDVAVSVQAASEEVVVGNSFEYAIFYENKGKDVAEDVIIEFELPNGVTYVGDTSGVPVEINGGKLHWNIGSLEVGQVGVINVYVNIESGFEEEVSFWDKIVPVAHAAEEDKIGEIVAVAYVGTSDTESDLTNNSASATTAVYSSELGDSDGLEDQRQPVLEITAKNNVNDFVYPGDIVTFEITVKNTSDVPSENTYLVQTLHNGVPGDFGKMEFYLGTIKPGEGGTLTFGLALKNNGFLKEGHYHTSAQAYGDAPNGNQVASNEVRTDFDIRYKVSHSFLDVKAAEEVDDSVLGESAFCPDKEAEEDILPYVFLLALSGMYLTRWKKEKLKVVKV